MAPRRKATGGDGLSKSPMLKLIVEKGPLAGQSNVFGPAARIQIGRIVRGNKLCIKDPGISSKHLSIEADSDSGKWTVTDLGSSNGTYLNDRLLDSDESAILSEGDVIKIGELTSIKVSFDVGEVAPESGGPVRRNARRGVRGKAAELVAIDEDSELGLVEKSVTGDEEKVKEKAAGILESVDVENKGEAVDVVEENANDGGEVKGKGKGKSRSSRKGLGLVESSVDQSKASVVRSSALSVVEIVDEGEEVEDEGVKGKGKSGNSRKEESLVELSVDEPKVSAMRSSAVSVVEIVDEGEKVEDEGVKKGNSRSSRKEGSLVELIGEMGTSSAVPEVKLVVGEKVEDEGVKGKGRKNVSTRNTRGSKKVLVESQRVSARVTRNSRKEDVLVDLSIIEGKGKRKGARGKTNAAKEPPTVENDSKGDLFVEQEVCVEKTVSVAVDNSSVVEGMETGEEGVARIVETSGVKEGGVEMAETSGQGAAGYVKGKTLKDLDTMTMGEWFDFLEVYLPQQVIIDTEKAISEMEDKARRLHEFRLQQYMRAKEKARR